MPHPFEVRKEIEVAADPDAIWEAIATGRGIDGWFLGTGNEVEPGPGGRVRISFGEGEYGGGTISAWEPPFHLAYAGEPAPDGSLHAFEYVIEARGGSRAVVRLVHSGFIAGDWEAEYDSLNEGDFMYLHQLAQYVTHFRGRTATAVSLWRWNEPDRDKVLANFRRSLGLPDDVAEGQEVHVDANGAGRIDGVVDFVSPGIIGVRTDDALYRFLHTPQQVAFVGHHIYRDDINPQVVREAWREWFDRAFA